MENKPSSDKGRLLVLDGYNGKILIFDTEGNPLGTLVDDCGGTPDGVCVDPENQHVYWTNMGAHWDQKDGYIERINYDGSDRQLIIKKGETTTAKQMQLDLKNRLIYWCDREGMRVMRSNLDGTGITTLVISGNGPEDQLDEKRHCVGIAIDPEEGYLYWTQKGAPKSGTGRIFRAGIDLPAGEDPASRKDLELLLEDLPEPIDLEINHRNHQLYWTDRGSPPGGNTLNRIDMDQWGQVEVLVGGFEEAIGLAMDIENDRIFVTDLSGSIYRSRLDGTNNTKIYNGQNLKQGFTGIVYVRDGLGW
ncbi:YncE family protein [Mucilaginibacter angelicae]|uniref:YncE family protein n=1 Tax=Mucilaginibacter angelicae TaxID=869718 RepID=A0ABV6KZP7_9SPHI